MDKSLLLRKYDLRFNPISNDAALVIFEAIEQNRMIRDVELNNNVDFKLRETLDTLMRKRCAKHKKAKPGKPKTKGKKK
jgi:hypothetical protein